MFGVGANRDESLARYLETLLPHHAALNYGKPGSNTWMHRTEFEYRLKTATPDIVIEWGGVNNDYNCYGRGSEYKVSWVERTALKSRFYRVLRMLVLTRFGLEVKPAFIGAADIPVLPITASEVTNAEFLAYLTADFGRMKALSEEKNIVYLVLTYPVHERDNEMINATGESLGLNVVDNYQLFQAFPPLNRHFFLYEDHHPNRAGYKLVALNVIHRIRQLSGIKLDPTVDEMVTRIVEQHELSKETVSFIFGEPLSIDRRIHPFVDPAQMLSCWTYEIKAAFLNLFWDDEDRMVWAFFRSPDRIDPNAWSRVPGMSQEGVRYLLGEAHEAEQQADGETWTYRHSVIKNRYRVQFAAARAIAQSVEKGSNPEDIDDLVGMTKQEIVNIYGEPSDIQTIEFPTAKPRFLWEKCSFHNELVVYLSRDKVDLALSPNSISRSIKTLLEKGDSLEEIDRLIGKPHKQHHWTGQSGELIRYHSYDMGSGKVMICYLQDQFDHVFFKYHTVVANSIDVKVYPLLPLGTQCEIVRGVWGPPIYWKELQTAGGAEERIWIYYAKGQVFMLRFQNGVITRTVRLEPSLKRVSGQDVSALEKVLGGRIHRDVTAIDGVDRQRLWFQLPEMKEIFQFTATGNPSGSESEFSLHIESAPETEG